MLEKYWNDVRALVMPDDNPSRTWVRGLVLVAAYFVTAKLGLGFATIGGSVTLLWPPTGIALFALLVFGVRLWPAVFIGSLAADFLTGIPAAASPVIAAGNTLEAVAGYYLLTAAGFQNRLERIKDVVVLAALGAGISTLIGATVGSLTMAVSQFVLWNDLGITWLTWWMGDAMGILVIGSVLFAWWGNIQLAGFRRIAEIALLVLCLVVTTELIFGAWLFNRGESWPLAFMTFPLLAWAALRFEARGATGATLIIGLVTLANIITGEGLFARETPLESLILLWFYINALALTGLVLAASVTERRHAEARMRHQALHDALTGLPNRLTLQAMTEQAIHRAQRRDLRIAMLFIDVDRFKLINDTLGHTVGDKLLGRIGSRLRECVRQGDTLTRHGGDEFIILFEGIDDANSVGRIADKLLERINRPFDIDGTPLYVTASIGISLYPIDGQDADTLLKNADTAMYRAKDLGRNTFAFYSAEMGAHAGERLIMEHELRHALERDEFLLHYQPQFADASGEIIGAEALLRWRRTDGMLVPPDKFIPLLEETGLINTVGVWVLDTACAQLAMWQAHGYSHLHMAVNVSSNQLHDPEFPKHVAVALAKADVQPKFLELEITESMLVRQHAVVERNISELVDLGVRLAVDDFGTGYSSLSYLHQLSIDTLKIDRSFVTHLPGEANCVAIARAIVGLGKSLRLRLIAEGVETPTQREFLQKLGCDSMQGFFFSPPLTHGEFGRLIAPSSARATFPD